MVSWAHFPHSIPPLQIHTTPIPACFQVEVSCEFLIPLFSPQTQKENPPTDTDTHLCHQHNHRSMIKTSRSQSLPVSQPSNARPQGIRRRLPSSSSSSSSSPYTWTWALDRSKSLSSMGENAGHSLKSWWDLTWRWILAVKPAFARDLELNEQEKQSVGAHSRGTWKHVLFKIRAEFNRILGFDNEGLPLTFRCHSNTIHG